MADSAVAIAASGTEAALRFCECQNAVAWPCKKLRHKCGFHTAIAHRLRQLNLEDWRTVCAGQSFYFSPEYLRMIEAAGPTNLEPRYDGTTAATLNYSHMSFNGEVAGDQLTVSCAVGTFDTPTVSTGTPVRISAITHGGSDAGDYRLLDSSASQCSDGFCGGCRQGAQGVAPAEISVSQHPASPLLLAVVNGLPASQVS